jgi:SAM-dependent methyltransferase
MAEESLPDPATFYDAYGSEEWDRLGESIDGRLEFERTATHLEERLPAGGHVLDAGGGAGRYAIRLAEQGYEVTLVDLSDEQLRIAERELADRGLRSRVALARGTINDLGIETAAFDATLCLGGPLSHLLDPADRARAVAELRRVTRPGGPVFASVMGRLGAIQLFLLSGQQLGLLPELLETGDYDQELLARHDYEPVFTETHYFRADELEELLADAGLAVETVAGLEGLASPFHDAGIRGNVADATDGERDALREVVHGTATERAVADCSVHMLAVATVPES